MLKKSLLVFLFIGVCLNANTQLIQKEEKELFNLNLCDKLISECLDKCDTLKDTTSKIEQCTDDCDAQYEVCREKLIKESEELK